MSCWGLGAGGWGLGNWRRKKFLDPVPSPQPPLRCFAASDFEPRRFAIFQRLERNQVDEILAVAVDLHNKPIHAADEKQVEDQRGNGYKEDGCGGYEVHAST